MNQPRAAAIDAVLHYELDALRVVAARVVNEHTNDHGACHACGRPFLCPRACLAEHNLHVCSDAPPTSVRRTDGALNT